MTKQHYFMFYEGHPADSPVAVLYMCDHEVTAAEWEEHLETFWKNQAPVRDRAVLKYCERTGWPHRTPESGNYKVFEEQTCGNDRCTFNRSEEFKAVTQWMDDNNPQDSFVKLHGMVRLEYVELGGN